MQNCEFYFAIGMNFMGFPSRILEVRWLPALLNLDCCAIVATIQIKQVRQPSYFQNAGRTALMDFCTMQKFLIMGGFNSFFYIKLEAMRNFIMRRKITLSVCREKISLVVNKCDRGLFSF